MRARRRRLKRQRQREAADKPIVGIELVQIPQTDVAEIWPLAERFISAAARYGEYSADELRTEAEGGTAQLWLAWSDHCEAAAITRIIPTPLGNVCVIVALGGTNMPRWFGLLDQLEAGAKNIGCSMMRVFGRLGWERKLTDYKLARVILDKRLT